MRERVGGSSTYQICLRLRADRSVLRPRESASAAGVRFLVRGAYFAVQATTHAERAKWVLACFNTCTTIKLFERILIFV